MKTNIEFKKFDFRFTSSITLAPNIGKYLWYSLTNSREFTIEEKPLIHLEPQKFNLFQLMF